jgi:hypothetical protein
MRIAAFGVAALAACAAPPAVPSDYTRTELAGRTAGAPQRCVNIQQNESLRIVGPNAFLYGAGRTVWLNVPPGDCRGLRDSDVLVTEPLGQYCRGDLVRSIDRYSKIPGPTCRLGDFIPYTRR